MKNGPDSGYITWFVAVRPRWVGYGAILGICWIFTGGTFAEMSGNEFPRPSSEGWVWMRAKTPDPAPRLPPSAVAEMGTEPPPAAGAGWQVSGSALGGVDIVTQDFLRCWRDQGWEPALIIPLGDIARHGQIIVWQKEKRRIILQLRQADAGRCSFAWGYENPESAGEIKESR